MMRKSNDRDPMEEPEPHLTPLSANENNANMYPTLPYPSHVIRNVTDTVPEHHRRERFGSVGSSNPFCEEEDDLERSISPKKEIVVSSPPVKAPVDNDLEKGKLKEKKHDVRTPPATAPPVSTTRSNRRVQVSDIAPHPNNPLVAVEAMQLQNRIQRRREAPYAFELKKQRHVFTAFLLWFWLSYGILSYQPNVLLIPQPLIDLYFPMVRYSSEISRETHISRSIIPPGYTFPSIVTMYTYLDSLNPFLIICLFTLCLAYLGFHAVPKCRFAKAIFSTVMLIISTVFFALVAITIFWWTSLPVLEEILPRCDAYDKCLGGLGDMRFASEIDETKCMTGIPTTFEKHPLPRECSWTQHFFLANCQKAEVPVFTLESNEMFDSPLDLVQEPITMKQTEAPHATFYFQYLSNMIHKSATEEFLEPEENIIILERRLQQSDADVEDFWFPDREPRTERPDDIPATQPNRFTPTESIIPHHPTSHTDIPLTTTHSPKIIPVKPVPEEKSTTTTTTPTTRKPSHRQPPVTHKPRTKSVMDCDKNLGAMIYFHNFIDDLGIHLLCATMSFWCLLIVLFLNGAFSLFTYIASWKLLQVSKEAEARQTLTRRRQGERAAPLLTVNAA